MYSLGVRGRIGLFSYCIVAMPTYDVYVWTKSRRLKSPRGLNIPSLEAAHGVALRMARVFIGLKSPRGHPSLAERDFLVEVVNENGQAVLTVPGRWMGPRPWE
jgi:hypothetical protein